MLLPDRNLGPYLPDLPALNNPGVTIANNCTAGFGAGNGQVVYESLRRASSYSSTATMPSRPRGAAIGKDRDGNARVYAGCATGLFRIDPATSGWADASRAGGYFTATGERWVSTEYDGYIFMANYSDFIQFIDMDVNDKFANATTLVKCRAIATVGEFVVAGNTWDSLDDSVPNRVRWSAIGNGADWNLAQSTQADFQDIYGYGAVQAIVGGTDGYILMRSGIQKMIYRGDSLIFEFAALPSALGKGCMIPQSVFTIEGKTFFVSDDGFYMLQGDMLSPIGAGQIDQTMLNDIDPTYYNKMSVAADPARKLIYWTYVSNNANDGQPDKQLILNYQTGNFTSADATVAFMFNSYSSPTTVEMLDVYGAIEAVPASFDSPIWAGGNAMLWGMNNAGNIYVFGGDILPATIETGETRLFNDLNAIAGGQLKGDKTNVNAVRIYFEGLDDAQAMVSIGSREQTNLRVDYSLPKPSNVDGFARFRVKDRFHRVKIDLGGSWSRCIGYQIDASSAGFR